MCICCMLSSCQIRYASINLQPCSLKKLFYSLLYVSYLQNKKIVLIYSFGIMVVLLLLLCLYVHTCH